MNESSPESYIVLVPADDGAYDVYARISGS
jgi:hypothetical protein